MVVRSKLSPLSSMRLHRQLTFTGARHAEIHQNKNVAEEHKMRWWDTHRETLLRTKKVIWKARRRRSSRQKEETGGIGSWWETKRQQQNENKKNSSFFSLLTKLSTDSERWRQTQGKARFLNCRLGSTAPGLTGGSATAPKTVTTNRSIDSFGIDRKPESFNLWSPIILALDIQQKQTGLIWVGDILYQNN